MSGLGSPRTAHAHTSTPDATHSAPRTAPAPSPLIIRDIAAVTLSFLPPKFRLRVAALVCKLWWRVVFGTADTLKLSLRPERPLHEILSSYPSVTDLTLRCGSLQCAPPPLRLPSALTALRLEQIPYEKNVDDKMRISIEGPCPPLTHLTLSSREETLLHSLLQPSLTSLRSLELVRIDVDLASWHFPSLTSLTVHSLGNELQFIKQHSTQLTYLSCGNLQLRGVYAYRMLYLRCPSLTRLDCRLRDMEAATPLIGHCAKESPMLRDVRLVCTFPGQNRDLADPVAHLLTSLTISVLNEAFCTDVLPMFTRLAYLSVRYAPCCHAIPLHCRQALQCVRLDLARTENLWPFLASCPNLAALSAVGSAAPDLFAASLPLPRLRKLRVIHGSLAAAAELISKFRAVAPALAKVTVTLLSEGGRGFESHEEAERLCEVCGPLRPPHPARK